MFQIVHQDRGSAPYTNTVNGLTSNSVHFLLFVFDFTILFRNKVLCEIYKHKCISYRFRRVLWKSNGAWNRCIVLQVHARSRLYHTRYRNFCWLGTFVHCSSRKRLSQASRLSYTIYYLDFEIKRLVNCLRLETEMCNQILLILSVGNIIMLQWNSIEILNICYLKTIISQWERF